MLRRPLQVAGGRLSRSFASVVDGAGGVKVASVDYKTPTSSITIFVNAGSRFETIPGVAGALKNFAFKGNAKRSALGTVRESELYGGLLSSTLSREHLALTAEFLRGDEEIFMDLLASFVTSGKYTRHEYFEYVQPLIQADSEEFLKNPAARALDFAHQLAFRGSGLGASLSSAPHHGPSHEDIKAYAAKVFTKENMAVLATGIEQETLTKLVDKYLGPKSFKPTSTGSVASLPSKYFGGQTRVESHDGPETVFVGYGLSGPPSLEVRALASYLSPTPRVKWSTVSSSSPISAALPADVSVQHIYLPYSDATLFGFLVQGDSVQGVKDGAAKVVAGLKSAASSIKPAELKSAIAKAKMEVASLAEGRSGLVTMLGPKVMAGSPASVDTALNGLDSLTPTLFTKKITELLKSTPTFVAVGQTASLPFPDELGL